MCNPLCWLYSCGGGPGRDDDFCRTSAKGGGGGVTPRYHAGPPVKTPHYPAATAPVAQRNGYDNYGYPGVDAHHANGHHNQPLPVAEEDRKASNDAWTGGPAPAPANAAVKGADGYVAGGQEKPYAYAGADGNPVANTVIAGGQEKPYAYSGADGNPVVAGGQEKPYVYAGADGNPVANTVVAGGAQHSYYHDREPAHKEYYYHYR